MRCTTNCAKAAFSQGWARTNDIRINSATQTTNCATWEYIIQQSGIYTE